MINPVQQTHNNTYTNSNMMSGVNREDMQSIQKFRNSFLDAREILSGEKMVSSGTKALLSCSIRELVIKHIPEEVETPESEMLKMLRCMFDIPVIIIGSDEDDMPHWINLGLGKGGTFRKFRISEEMLKQMSEDPAVFKEITEKMQRWYDHTAEFLKNYDGVITSMEMYISETGIVYAYTENFDAPEDVVKKAKAELNDLHDFFLRWLERRDNDLKTTEEDNEESTAEDSSEYMIENAMSA